MDTENMSLVEEAIIYATLMHRGKTRKRNNIPYILHPLEVAQILSTLTSDQETIAAGILHDIVEDTEGTIEEIRQKFGDRVAFLVDSETETPFPDEDRRKSWKKRKELSLMKLKKSGDIGVKMLWLADKLANIRSLVRDYSENGESLWNSFNQKDPGEQCWYYRTVAEYLEYDLNRTGAYKELIKNINHIWPGTFDSDKTRYRKYREVSVEGCRLIGSGKKGEVYRYDDELILKVYNPNNTYNDVEREIALSRRAFVLGIPTAISFGIVSVGDRYGAMYELVNSETLSACILRNPSGISYYAGVMSDLAHIIHGTKEDKKDAFPDAGDRFRRYIRQGLENIDFETAGRCMRLINEMPDTDHLIHGDFHTSNVFLQDGEALLIDMDRLSTGDPVFELADMYIYYASNRNVDEEDTDPYLGISFGLCRKFYNLFLKAYLETEDEEILKEALDKAALLGNLRLISRKVKAGVLKEEGNHETDRLLHETKALLDRVESLNI